VTGATPRPELEADLLARFPGAWLTPMVGDASTRRFWRLHLPAGGSRVVMDYGQPFEAPPDDVALTRILETAGLPVAALLEARPGTGCLVLEDLGDRTLESALSALPDGAGGDAPRERFYAAAVDLAVGVARRGSPALAASERAAGPALDAARFRFEMDFFLEHFAAGLRGTVVSPELRRALHELADAAASSSAPVLCHRDYHSRNLMVRSDGSLAMVDIQDARWGPDTYDLASLLRDAYVEVDEALVDRMIDRFRQAVGGSADALRTRFDLVAAERMVKALGTFGYQATVRGNARYLEGVPRTLRRLRHTLAGSPGLVPLGERLSGAGLLNI
jgi:aminoglycoside/choline kinase family phosphotransferase